MTTPTDTELAQALRTIVEWQPPAMKDRDGNDCSMALLVGSNGVRDYFRKIAADALAAHERAQPAKPDGYAYRYADGFLRFNQGAPVNGGKPIEAIPFYFAPQPAQPASVADGWVPIDERQPPRNTYAVYWHKSDHGGFPAIADEWRDEHHRAFATHWHPEASLGPQPPAKEPQS